MIYYKEQRDKCFWLVSDKEDIEYSRDFTIMYNRTRGISKRATACHIDVLSERITFVYPEVDSNTVPVFDVMTADGVMHSQSTTFFSQNWYADSVAKMLKTIGYEPYTKTAFNSIDITDRYINVPLFQVNNSACLFVAIEKNKENLVRCTKFFMQEENISIVDCFHDENITERLSITKDSERILFEIKSYLTDCSIKVDIENALKIHQAHYQPRGFRWCKETSFLRDICLNLIDFFVDYNKRGLKSNLIKLKRELNKNSRSHEHCETILVSLISLLISKNISLNNLKV